MSGLIWAGMGKGISDAGTTMGSLMTRAMERDIEAERRRLEREEDKQFRRDQDALYRRPADSIGSGGGGSRSGSGAGTGSLGPMTEEDRDLEALQLGLTRPDYDRFIAAQQSGDTRGFQQKREVQTEPYAQGYSDQVSRANRGTETTSELPPGFEKEFDAKQKALGRIREARGFGSAYDDVTKGRATQQGVDAAQGILDETDPAARRERAGVIGTAMAAREGKPIYTVKGDTNLQQFTGASDTTEVGDSKILKNERPPAAKAGGSGGGGSGGGAGDVDLKTLQQMRLAAQGQLTTADRALANFDRIFNDLPSREREARKAERQGLVDRVTTAQTELSNISARLASRLPAGPGGGASAPRAEPKAAPAPAPSNRPAAATSSGIPTPRTRAEFDSLASGTRYKAPDGSTRIKP